MAKKPRPAAPKAAPSHRAPELLDDDDDDEDDGRETSIRLATLRPLGVVVVVVVCHGSSSTARAMGKEACRDQAKVRTDLNTTADPRERDAIVTAMAGR